ncbi:MAG: hypothetical protein M1833_005832, partial [Piccolia ochrophora]
SRQRGGQWQLSRLLTTERKQYLKYQAWLTAKWGVGIYGMVFLFLVTSFGFAQQYRERKYPSPREWSFWTRYFYRNAQWEEDPGPENAEIIDWTAVGNYYRDVVRRLEDPTINGQGVTEQEEGGILVLGVGQTGKDISTQPETWRRGYVEALMGCARAAQNLDSWIADKTRRLAFPSSMVIGPSNPNPRPCPPGSPEAPLEENCEPAFEGPETFYMKILTTKGVTTKERLLAALAYADWLDYKNLPSSAEDMYQWALDIASSPLEKPSAFVSPTTGVLNPSAPEAPSPNLLLATTSLAIHHARTGNTSAALPIFLSVLRARRSLSASPSALLDSFPEEARHHPSDPTAPQRPSISPSATATFLATLKSLFVEPPFPPPPPTGDTPALRNSTSICEEAGLMANIGELLFAASATPTEGLAWTRSAVDLAESQLGAISPTDDTPARTRCRECMNVGLKNWQMMVEQLARDAGADGPRKSTTNDIDDSDRVVGGAKDTEDNLVEHSTTALSKWKFWAQKPSAQAAAEREGERQRWEAEKAVVELRMKRAREALAQERMRRMAAGQVSQWGPAIFGK